MRGGVSISRRLITGAYAVAVLLLGCALTLLGVMMFGVMHIGSEPLPIIAAFLVPGLVFVVLGIFIWRRNFWAIITAGALALAYGAVLLWTNASSLFV